MDKRIAKELISWIIVIVVAASLAFLINKTIIFKVVTPTGSMENTIMAHQKVEVFRLAYVFNNPKRGDIVVFPFPDDESEDRLKRIIGLPGETIEGKDGLVYIDGKPLTESYVKDALDENFGPFTIPEGKYFMMGDNRNDSLDARNWENKFVSKGKIKGKAIFKFPFKWIG
jgi:signal peptidase I